MVGFGRRLWLSAVCVGAMGAVPAAHAGTLTELGLKPRLGVGAPPIVPPPPIRVAAPATLRPKLAPDPSRFVLSAVMIDGVSAYPLADLAPLYADYLAREIGMDEVVKIATAVTDKYRADGYFLSRAVVPVQDGPPGVVRLRVYEGYIGEVSMDGEGAKAVEPLFHDVTRARPVRLRDLDHRLSLANDLPGIHAKLQVEPMIDDPARHKLKVTASLSKINGSVYIDNRGARSVGPVQAYGRAALNSVVVPGDQVGVALLTTPLQPNEFIFGELSYGLSRRDGTRLRAAVTASRSHNRLAALSNEFGGQSRGLNLRIATPLMRERKRSVWAAVAFDARHVEQSFPNGAGYMDELRVLRGSLQGDFGDGVRSTSLSAQVSQGLSVLGASGPGVGLRSRYDADGEFTKVNLQAAHYRDITARAGIYFAASGQWASGPLLLSEEFAPGGLPYGRAYNYSEISGDDGIAGLAELRVGWNPKLKPITFFQTYAFVDAARVWNKQSPFSVRTAQFSSAGLGLRLNFGDNAILRFEAAKPLSAAPYETGTNGWRTFVSLWAGL